MKGRSSKEIGNVIKSGAVVVGSIEVQEVLRFLFYINILNKLLLLQRKHSKYVYAKCLNFLCFIKSLAVCMHAFCMFHLYVSLGLSLKDWKRSQLPYFNDNSQCEWCQIKILYYTETSFCNFSFGDFAVINFHHNLFVRGRPNFSTLLFTKTSLNNCLKILISPPPPNFGAIRRNCDTSIWYPTLITLDW